MANARLIRFYKGIVVDQIYKHLNRDNLVMTFEQVDSFLKSHAKIDMSSIQMSNEELHHVILKSFEIADAIGLELDYPQDEKDKLLDFRDIK